jgi:hypothetical protein
MELIPSVHSIIAGNDHRDKVWSITFPASTFGFGTQAILGKGMSCTIINTRYKLKMKRLKRANILI